MFRHNLADEARIIAKRRTGRRFARRLTDITGLRQGLLHRRRFGLGFIMGKILLEYRGIQEYRLIRPDPQGVAIIEHKHNPTVVAGGDQVVFMYRHVRR